MFQIVRWVPSEPPGPVAGSSQQSCQFDSRMSQYGINDPSKWGLDPGLSPLSGTAPKTLYNGNGSGYRAANGSSPISQWQGIRLPTTPSGPHLHPPPWDSPHHFRSPVSSSYLHSPYSTSGGLPPWATSRHFPTAHGPPQHKLPHTPQPLRPSVMQGGGEGHPLVSSASYLSRLPPASHTDPSLLPPPAVPPSGSVPGDLLPPDRIHYGNPQLDLDAIRNHLTHSQHQSGQGFVSPPARAPSANIPNTIGKPGLSPAFQGPHSSPSFSAFPPYPGIKPELQSPPGSYASDQPHAGLLSIHTSSNSGRPMDVQLPDRDLVKTNGNHIHTSTAQEASPCYQQISPTTTTQELGVFSEHRDTPQKKSGQAEQVGEEKSPKADSTNCATMPVPTSPRVSEAQDYSHSLPPSSLPDQGNERPQPISGNGNEKDEMKMDVTVSSERDQSSTAPTAEDSSVLSSSPSQESLSKPYSVSNDTGQQMDQTQLAQESLNESSSFTENPQSDPSNESTTAPNPDNASTETMERQVEERPESNDLAPNLVVDTDMVEPITPPSAENTGMGPGSAAVPSESNVNAAKRLEEKIMNEAMGREMVGGIRPMMPQFPLHPHTVTRPPGLVPPSNVSQLPASFPGFTGGGYQCPICAFTCTSKFHFNSHMNTHTDHRCSMCDYRARTEGRLKRHMKEFHSREEQVAAGINPASGAEMEPGTPNGSNNSFGNEPSPLEKMQQTLDETQIALAHALPRMDQEKKPQSTGKPKNYKCKQCEHVSRSKEESWNHNRTHIKPDKLLTCPKCEFVTEYKHHLEYHLRNHFGSKPFRCTKCSYSCVNKSMLNSHMKSHSSYYQFRCSDCTYATKYCHSLKLHLKKYAHRPATAIGADGSTLDPSQLDLGYGPGGGTPRRNSRKRGDSASGSSPFGSPTHSQHGDSSPAGSAGLNMGGGMPTMVPLMEAARMGNLGMASNIATLGAHLPTISNLHQFAAAAMGGSNLNKCKICPYTSTSAEDLEKHNIMHIQESRLAEFERDKQNSIYTNFANQLANLTSGAAHGSTNVTPPVTHPSSHPGSNGSGQDGSDGISTAEHSPSGETRSPHGTVEGSGGSTGSPISGGKGSGDEGTGSNGGAITSSTGSSRRKGKAFKLDAIAQRLHNRGLSPEEREQGEEAGSVIIKTQPTTSLIPQRFQRSDREQLMSEGAAQRSSSVSSYVRPPVTDSQGDNSVIPGWRSAHICDHCQIAFQNEVMYTIHMGYHGYDNPFRCNRCGHLSQDSLSMFMHIAQAKH